jgi:cytidylate kinase
MNKITIAIDGYSSCGKSTLAKSLANKLNYIYVDTGAMYRAITLWCLDEDLIVNGNAQIEYIVNSLDQIHLSFDADNNNEVYLNGNNVSTQIRSMHISDNVSLVSSIKEVRNKLVAIQQDLGKSKGVVMDGRDIGTVVFPNAEIKIFMTADPKVRGKRRFDELKRSGVTVTVDEVLNNIIKRDYKDTNREESPLVKAHDAITLDNTHMTPDEQLQFVLDHISKNWG